MKKEALAILTNAVIWALCIIMCAFVLRGTDAYTRIQLILSGSALASLLALVAIFVPKKKK